jgi:hypothetical protein
MPKARRLPTSIAIVMLLLVWALVIAVILTVH